MILVRLQGTCGNQLWQYAVARIYAEEHGHRLHKDASYALRDDLVYFPNATDLHDGHDQNGFHHESTVNFLDGPLHDFKPISANQDAFFLGYFQRFEYIKSHKEKIQRWFEVDKELPIKLTQSDLVLSIRRGWNGYPVDQCPPAEFYQQIIEKENPSRIILCTDTFSDSYFDFLQKYPNVHFADYEMMTQFCLIKSAKKVVLSPSTFCWWAAWLGNATVVYYPLVGDLIPTEGGVNWLVDDDPRYIVIPLGEEAE